MVPSNERVLILRRVGNPTLFLFAAALAWWAAGRSGIFYLPGLGQPWSDRLGPLLPALCAGISVTLILRIADNAVSYVGGLVAAMLTLLLPTFMPVHGSSLLGPPLLVIFLVQLAIMLQAPRFSIAYGTVAAVAAISVSSAGLGLPLAAIIWPLLSGRGEGAVARVSRRSLLALVPLLVVLVLAHVTGTEWTPEEPQVAPGWMSRGLWFGLQVLSQSLAPGISDQRIRVLAVTVLSLSLLLINAIAWRQRGRKAHGDSVLGRFYPAALLLALCYLAGLVQRLMWTGGGALPDQAALLPIETLIILFTSISVTALWPVSSQTRRSLLVMPALIWLAMLLRALVSGT